MIGLSLSFCVQQCIEGKVDPASVTKVYTSTCVRDDDWSEVVERYRESFWRKDPDRGEAIFRDWLVRGIIVQPRLEDKPTASTNGGLWVQDESQIEWRIAREDNDDAPTVEHPTIPYVTCACCALESIKKDGDGWYCFGKPRPSIDSYAFCPSCLSLEPLQQFQRFHGRLKDKFDYYFIHHAWDDIIIAKENSPQPILHIVVKKPVLPERI